MEHGKVSSEGRAGAFPCQDFLNTGTYFCTDEGYMITLQNNINYIVPITYSVVQCHIDQIS